MTQTVSVESKSKSLSLLKSDRGRKEVTLIVNAPTDTRFIHTTNHFDTHSRNILRDCFMRGESVFTCVSNSAQMSLPLSLSSQMSLSQTTKITLVTLVIRRLTHCTLHTTDYTLHTSINSLPWTRRLLMRMKMSQRLLSECINRLLVITNVSIIKSLSNAGLFVLQVGVHVH